MPYQPFQLGGGLNTDADATAIRQDQLTTARGCGFDKSGSVGSAKGRTELTATPIGASVNGHFAAKVDGTRARYTKAGTTVYEDFTTTVGTFSGSGAITGFGYNGYAYLADNASGMKRWNGSTLIDAGLDAPGYQELGDDPISISTTTATVTTPVAHGFASNDYVFHAGLVDAGGVPADELNGVHQVTVATPTTYTFTVSTSGSGSGGGGAGIILLRADGAAASGGNLTDGVYKYVYTFYNGVAESNFSHPVSVTVSGGPKKVSLSNIKAGLTGTTSRRIYRTDVNKNTFFFVGEITSGTEYEDTGELPYGADVGTVTGADIDDQTRRLSDADKVSTSRSNSSYLFRRFRSSFASRFEDSGTRDAPDVVGTNLGILADWTDHDPPPSDIKHLVLHQEQAWGITGSEIAFSKSGQMEHWPIYNRFRPGRNSSETPLAIVPFGRDMIAYTDHGIYQFSQVGISSTDSRLVEIESPVGLAGEWAVAALDGALGHVFLAPTGLYLFDGREVTKLEIGLTDLFEDSTHADYINPTYMSSAWIAVKGKVLVMSYGVSAANDRELNIDFSNQGDPKISTIVRSSTTLVRERDTDTLISGDSAGDVYEHLNGWSENGSTLAWNPVTKEHGLGDDDVFVAVEKVVIDANLGGATTTATLTTNGLAGTKTFSWTISGSTRERYVKYVPAYMKGETVKLGLSSSAATERRWYGYGFVYEPMSMP